MSELQVRIVDLGPLRCAGAAGYGPEPEGIAWDTLLKWAEPIGLLSQPHRFFGYNNPNPSPGTPNYGYDQWITIAEDVPVAEPIKIKEFPGGRYAVARCKGVQNIYATWQQLVAWRETSPYRMGQHQWLEELLTPPGDEWEKAQFDLYMPIAE
jgi:AraC family transcriptional regulator